MTNRLNCSINRISAMRHRNQISNIVEKKNMNFNIKYFDINYRLESYPIFVVLFVLLTNALQLPATHESQSSAHKKVTNSIDTWPLTHHYKLFICLQKKVVRQSAHSKQMSKMANAPKC